MPPIDVRLVSDNVLPNALLRIDLVRSALAFYDLIALSGGHDFLLQASNRMCTETAFGSLNMPWIHGQLNAQAVAALRTSATKVTSPVLQQIVNAPVGSIAASADVLLLFTAHDVQFDGGNQCRVRLRVNVALGDILRVPKEPPLVRTPKLGETVQQFGFPANVIDPVQRIGLALLAAGTALAPPPPTMQTLSNRSAGGLGGFIEFDRSVIDHDVAIQPLNRKIDLGDRTSFDVAAWLGVGLLEIPAAFAATGNAASKTIRVTADVRQSSPQFTDLTGDAAVLLAEADPLGLRQAITYRVRQRGDVTLIDVISLLGAPANANGAHLGPLSADVFPCRTGASPLNAAATVMAGRQAARSNVEFIGSSRYGVLWSADAVKMLVRYCWEIGAFPRGITQTQTDAVKLRIDGVEQMADAISIFHLDTLDVIELEYDANARRDVLYTRGIARVIPKLLRLRDGRELAPKNADDPLFAPSAPQAWAALGELTEEPPSTSAPDLLWFENAITRGVTSRLGRPFADPPNATVTASRLSAPAQRVALLV